jgi:hypothetical protein
MSDATNIPEEETMERQASGVREWWQLQMDRERELEEIRARQLVLEFPDWTAPPRSSVAKNGDQAGGDAGSGAGRAEQEAIEREEAA